MELFHADIRLPDGFVKPTGRVELVWTRHAENARQDDRYGMIRRFKTATLDRLDVIEVGMENDRVAKILFRGAYRDGLDVCMVLIPGAWSPLDPKPWIVKTVWINETGDAHGTLDRSRYVK